MAGAWNAGSMVLLGMMLIVMLVQPIMVSDTSVKPAESLLSAFGWVQLIYHDMEDSIADAPDYQSGGSWSWTTDYYHSPTTSILMTDETLGWDYCTAEPCPSHVKADVWIRKGAPAGVPEFDFSLTDGLEPDEDGYTLVWDFANDKVSIVYRENGGSTETKLDEATLAVTYGSWYMMELEIDYDNGFIYGRIYNSNGELLAELESPITSTPTLKRTTVYGGGDQYIDDLAVYEYTDSDSETPGIPDARWRTPITITNNADTDLTDFQVKITLNADNWDGWEHVNTIGDDIYFTDADGTPLYYWIEHFDYTGQEAVIWVKVPLIPANSNVTIYLYYGSTNSYPEYNNPYKVFIAYDDFNNQTASGELVGVEGTDWGFTYMDDVDKYALWLDNIETDYAKIQYILSYSVDLPIVVEYDFWVATTTLRNGYTIVGYDDGATFTKIIRLMYASGNIQSYDGSAYTDLVPPANYGTTRKHFKLIVDSNDPKLIDTEEHTVNVWNSLAEINKIVFTTYTVGYYTGKRYLDNIRIYKFIDPEPTIYIGNSVFTSGKYRTPITITNNANIEITDFQIKIELNSSSWDGWNNVADDGADVYFMDSSGSPLYYWIEDFNYEEQNAIIWVKVPRVPANGNTVIYMYYGGTNLYQDYSDPDKVFLFYDDFNGTSLDTNKWITWDDTGATVTVSDSILDIYRPAGKRIKMNTTITFEVDTGVVLEAKQYVVQISNYYYHTYAIGNDEAGFSSVGYVIYSGYESAIYTGDELRPPRTGASSSLDGDIIDNPIGGIWQTIQFVIPVNDYLKHKYDNNDWQVSTRYQGITCENAKLVMWFQAAGNYAAETKIDWIRVYKYIEPAPTINIGASEVVGGGVSFSGSVSPTTVSITLNGDNGYEYSVTFTMNVSNTGTVDSWSVAKLVDGRDDSVVFSENVTLAVNESTTLTYTHSFTLDDRGTYNWYYIVENDTKVFVNQTISITVNAEFEQSYEYTIQFSASMNPTVVTPYTFEYTLEPSAGQSVSMVESHIYEYTINMSSSQTTAGISSHRNPQLLGSRVCMGIYLNDTNVYYVCTATVYTIAFRFQYIVESGEGYPDAYIKIYENDTGEMELYTSIYIPQGDTAVMLPANHTYAVEIPSTGTTIYGYSFELVDYDVNGEGEKNTIILDRDYTFTITYRIYDDNSGDNGGGDNTPSSSITITITYPELNASDLLPPSIGIGEPSLYSPEGIILVAMFIGIFIVFARVFPWGQALTVASILSAIVSILLFKSLTVTGIFMALFMAGLIAWKVLGK